MKKSGLGWTDSEPEIGIITESGPRWWDIKVFFPGSKGTMKVDSKDQIFSIEPVSNEKWHDLLSD